MASFPQNHFQQFLQQPPAQTQQSKPYSRDMYNSNMEGQISQQVHAAYFNTPNLLDHHPPYIPPFQVAGLAPGPANEDNGPDLQWNFGHESKRQRPIEQVFLENHINNNNSNNNSQISVADLMQARSVSTGLGLSLDTPRLSSSSGDSTSLGLFRDAVDYELQNQDAEIVRCIKLQSDRIRQAVLEKFQATRLETISYVEDKISHKLREREAEVQDMSKKNAELQLRLEQLAAEADTWQQRAKQSENNINALKLNLEQVYAQSRGGDSAIDDTASFCKVDYEFMRSETKGAMTCKLCGVDLVCMLLLPCKHLCLCKNCESRTSTCPLCRSSKYIGMEVYM